ncbi:hypothetical protein HPB48_024555 [Haemaphysalis longicornis]|uniref:Peptidase M13 N-terminal domain-containing protein n=1 Tax=Haemaphysalis longicornis TaxID=44386 RepID=A0A9J6H7W3_HAELO|nr:hypothetical protein HPB48_024555 [Haemaphysalis longicornis]
MDDSRAMDWYRESVGRAIRVLYRGHEQDKIVDALLEIERRLARAIESLPTRKSAPFYRVTLGSVPGGVLWDWVSFLNGVLKGSAAAGAHQPVAVRSMLFLHRLARITHDTPAAVLLNYLGYRLLVAVAPFLQSPATEHLVPLSVEGLRIPGMERLQACGQLAEKVFGAALTVMLRHATPGLHHADMARKMVGLVNSAADALERFLKQDVLPMHVPRFLHHVLRGLFATVADMQVRIPGEEAQVSLANALYAIQTSTSFALYTVRVSTTTLQPSRDGVPIEFRVWTVL